MLNSLQLDARSKGLRVSITDVKGLQHLTVTAGVSNSGDPSAQLKIPRPISAVGSLMQTPPRGSGGFELSDSFGSPQASPVHVHQSTLPISVHIDHWNSAQTQIAPQVASGGGGGGVGSSPYAGTAPGTPQLQQRPSTGGASSSSQVGLPASQLALDSPEFASLVTSLLSVVQTEAVRAAADWIFRHASSNDTPLVDRIAHLRSAALSTSLIG